MGKIIELQVTVMTATEDGRQRTTIDLNDLRRCCQAERVNDFLDDLAVLVADVHGTRKPSLRETR